MRNTIAAAAIAMLASSGSAFAADCTKGLLWPYVRNPGDCLTEQEVKTGVYQGAPQGPVDVGNIKSPMQPAMPITAQDCHETGIWPFRSEECTTVVKAGVTVSAPPAPQPAVAGTPSAPAPVAQAAPAAVVTQTSAAPGSCSKGLLWPFVRDNGDCPTEIERAGGAKTPVSVPTSAPAQATAVATPAVVTQVSAAPAAPATPAATSCGKSWLWPFVRDAGDCPTAIEKSSGVKPAASVPASAPAQAAAVATPAVVTQVSAAPAAPAAPAATSCGKSWLWPFVRDSGDCPTAIEKTSGVKTAASVPASAPAQPAPAAMPAVMTQATPVAAPAAAPASTSCGKGLLWPFVRDSGDCATAAGKGSEPAVVPASGTMAPPAAAPAETGCHKGLLWPFVRDPGDCPSSAEQGQTRSGRS
jgi:hypothetical protein